jgi:uncharacterized damage-inducible protein DinB
MKKLLIVALALNLTVATAMLAQGSKTSPSPVADAARAWLQVETKNLTAAAQDMPADKYDFRASPQQMTFAHLMMHIGVSNRIMCSQIAGDPQPKDSGLSDKDGKEKLLAEVQSSFDYCASALAKVDDSKLADELPLFKRTRANVMMFLVADLADHYGLAATYLRLNGIVPPTAQPKK